MSKLIERDAAVEVLNELVRERFSLADGFQFYIDALKDVELNVMALPTVDAVPVVHGRWETVEDWDGDEHYQCSVCGAEFVLIDGDPDDNDYLYCPHCGARMDGKDGDHHD